MERLESIWATSRGKGFRRHYTQRWLWGPCAGFTRPARHRGGGGASAAVGARKSGTGSSWHPTRNVPRNQIRQRDDAIGTRRLGNFSERWILLGAEFRGRILWHGKRAGGMRKLAG